MGRKKRKVNRRWKTNDKQSSEFAALVILVSRVNLLVLNH